MGIFTKLFGRRATERAERQKLIKKLDGRAIKYVIERLPEEEGAPASDRTGGFAANELIIGRAGALIIKGGELLVFADGLVLFRADIAELDASELLSLEGVILIAPDLEHDRRVRKIVAYYTYYLK